MRKEAGEHFAKAEPNESPGERSRWVSGIIEQVVDQAEQSTVAGAAKQGGKGGKAEHATAGAEG